MPDNINPLDPQYNSGVISSQPAQMPGQGTGGMPQPQPSASVSPGPSNSTVAPSQGTGVTLNQTVEQQIATLRQQAETAEARYNGMNARYQQDVATLRQQFSDFQTQMQQVLGAVQGFASGQRQPPVTNPQSLASTPSDNPLTGNTVTPQSPQGVTQPTAGPPVSSGNSTPDPAQQASLRELRLRLLNEYSQQGARGEGLNLHQFEQQIPLPAVGQNGALDLAVTTQAIDSLIGALQSARQAGAQAAVQEMRQGTVPGASTEPAPQQTQLQQDYARFQELKGLIGTPSFRDMPEPDKQKLRDEYAALLTTVGHFDPFINEPFVDPSQVAGRVRRQMMGFPGGGVMS